MKKGCLFMKTVYVLSKNEAMMIDEILAAYGKGIKISEIKKSWHGIRIEITSNNRRDMLLKIEMPEDISLGLGEIILKNTKTIKGIAQTIDGLCKTLDSLAKNIGKDIKALFQKYDEGNHNS